MRQYFYLLLIPFLNYAQTSERLKIPDIHSPNTAALGQYGNYPVSMQTGVANIEIPIYTIKNSFFQLPISLTYHTSGIKVSQESSTVGLGWSLNAGGAIIRTLKDKPDEDADGFLTNGKNLISFNEINSDLESMPIGQIYYYPYESMDGVAAHSSPVDEAYSKDNEPDNYSINTALINAEFTIDNTGNYVFTEYSDNKILANTKNGIDESFFEIKDTSGIVYRFGKSYGNELNVEKTSVITTSLSLSSSPPPDTPMEVVRLPSITSWMLSDIITPDNSEHIVFKYKNYNISESKPTSQSYFFPVNHIFYGATNGYNYSGEILNSSTSVVESKVIDKIIFKEGRLEFVYVEDRLDTVSQPRLNFISVFNNNNELIKKVIFVNNSYFERIGAGGLPIGNIQDYWKKSLKLTEVRFNDKKNNYINSYKFEYNPLPLPPRYVASQDYWGYYNGKDNNSFLPNYTKFDSYGIPLSFGGNKNSDKEFMKAGILSKIFFPTGGYTEYEYEPNYYLNNQSPTQSSVSDKRNKSVAVLDMTDSSLCTSGFEFNDTFRNVQSHTIKEFDVVEDASGIAKLTVHFSDYQIVDFGVNNYDGMKFKVETSRGFLSNVFQHSPSNKDNQVTYTYEFNISKGDHIKLDAITNGVKGSIYSPCGSPYIEAYLSYEYDTLVTQTSTEVKPEPCGGLRIKSIFNYDQGGVLIGKKRYQYGNTLYGESNVGVGKLLVDPKKNLFHRYELYTSNVNGDKFLIDEMWYSSNSIVDLGMNNGIPVDYDNVIEFTEDINGHNRFKTEYFFTGNIPNILSTSNYDRPYDSFLYPTWRKNFPSKTVHYKQISNNNFVKVHEENFEYLTFPEKRIKNFLIFDRGNKLSGCHTQNNGHTQCLMNRERYWVANGYISTGLKVLSKKTTLNYLNNEVIKFSTEYFHNSPSHFGLTREVNLQSNNSSYEKTYHYAYEKANQKLINANIVGIPLQTTVTKTVNGVPKTISNQETRYDNPAHLLPTSVINYDLLTSIQSTEITYDKYDGSNGNLQQYTLKSGIPVAIIWGYNNTQPIAKIEGANYDAISGLLPSIINASNNDAMQGTPETENALISALDLFRTNSALSNYLITTYTYDPLIGVTSITPPSGIRESYKYDAANRLEKIVDINGNILKEYKYNYKQ